MRNTAKMPMPGALRLRNLHALTGPDGATDLVYDLERGLVVEVPIELQAHIALALERTEPDDELLSFLVREDLLTSERFSEWTLDDSFAGLGWGWLRSEREIHFDLDRPAESEAIDALDLAFRPGGERRPIRLRLYWPEQFPGVEALRAISLEANRRAAAHRQPVSFEVVLPMAEVNDSTIRCLVSEAFGVRLTSPLPTEDAAERFEARLGELTARLQDRLTLRLDLPRGARLAEAHRLAAAAGVRHLDVDWRRGGEPATSAELGRLEDDLSAISVETCTALLARRAPLDFQPVTRVVGRLIQRQPFDFERERSSQPAWIGDVDPDSGLRGMEPPDVARLWSGVAEFGAEDEDTAPCWSCWARYLCPESRIRASLAEALPPEPVHCGLLLKRFEAGVRLHHRLAQMDPLMTLQFLELAARISAEPQRPGFGARGGSA